MHDEAQWGYFLIIPSAVMTNLISKSRVMGNNDGPLGFPLVLEGEARPGKQKVRAGVIVNPCTIDKPYPRNATKDI